MRRTLLLVAAVLVVAFASVPTAVEAKHAYGCDVSHDENVNNLYCAPHCAWDTLSGGWWKYILQCFL